MAINCFHTAGATGSIPVPPTRNQERRRCRPKKYGKVPYRFQPLPPPPVDPSPIPIACLIPAYQSNCTAPSIAMVRPVPLLSSTLTRL
jgi:hypothetical protein